VSRLYAHVLNQPPHYLRKRLDEISALSQLSQINLMLKYRELHRAGIQLRFEDVEFSAYSQNGEDGILLYLFSVLGTTNKIVLEVGSGDGIENNSANLIINHGWTAHLFDASAERVEAARTFYRSARQTRIWPPTMTCTRVTPATIDRTVKAAGLSGPIDLVSLDIDGIDYWVWDALTIVDPRVVVVEFNNLWPAEATLSVPNDPAFEPEYNSPCGADFSGATLGAFVKLARRKGYRLVGSERYGFNAFFVKNCVGEDTLPEVAPESCLTHPYSVHARAVRSRGVLDRPWVEV
jgi:hypothetical protein